MPTLFLRTLMAAALGSVIVAPVIAAPAPAHAAQGKDGFRAALTARLGSIGRNVEAARKAGRISPADAVTLRRRLARVQIESTRFVRRQGFLSAGESASYNRTLDKIEAKLAG